MKITQEEYLQVIALLKMARDKNKEAEQYTESLGKVLGDVDLAFDYVYGYPERNIDQLLKDFDIEVTDD